MITAKQLDKVTTLLHKNRPQQARDECQKLLKKAPADAELTYLLALSFIGLTRAPEAEALLIRLNKQFPQRADVCNALAQLYKIRAPEQALYWQQCAVERKPSAEHLTNLATLLSQQGFSTNAILTAKQAVLSSSQSGSAELLLCSLLNKAGRFRESLTASSNLPDSIDKQLLQAEAWIGLNQPEEAETILDILCLSALNAVQLRFVVTAYQSLGNSEKAAEALRKHAVSVDQYGAIFLKLKLGSVTVQEVSMLVRQFDKLSWPESNKAQLAFELAKSYKKNDKESWLNWLHRANAMQRQLYPYDETSTLRQFNAATARLNSMQLPLLSNNDIEPVFIVGMPRSGTTLVESILNAHSQCFACGESNALNAALQLDDGIPEISHQAYFNVLEHLGNLNETQLTERVKRYVKHMRQFADKRHLIDKMPHNFLYTLVISRLFPKARIIHVSRHPVATILSVYAQSFSSFHSYGNDLDTLVRYYKQYQQFMQQCLSLLPEGRVYQLCYEHLISAPEMAVRSLLEHCQLPFEEQCLRFEHQQRTVTTASVNQVRRGIYQSSLTPWVGLEQQLSELLQSFDK